MQLKLSYKEDFGQCSFCLEIGKLEETCLRVNCRVELGSWILTRKSCIQKLYSKVVNLVGKLRV